MGPDAKMVRIENYTTMSRFSHLECVAVALDVIGMASVATVVAAVVAMVARVPTA